MVVNQSSMSKTYKDTNLTPEESLWYAQPSFGKHAGDIGGFNGG